MNAAQSQIFSQIEAMLREHFDASVIVVQSDTEDGKGDSTQSTDSEDTVK